MRRHCFWGLLAAAVAQVPLASVDGCLAAPTAVTSYDGFCEASATVALDGTHFVVADDESNILRIYERGNAAPQPIDLSAFLGAPKSDIEAGAAVGNRVYWISSHSRNKDGEVKPARFRFFATKATKANDAWTLAADGRSIDTLRDALISAPSLLSLELGKAADGTPKNPGALDIEGLAEGDNGSLLIGFRNPVRNGKALLVPLRNPAGVIEGASPVFGDPVGLDLAGRGIRSIDRVAGAYWIVAGPWDASADFALYRWSGKPEEAPSRVGAGQPVDTSPAFSPEALFLIPGSDPPAVQILSDDGKLAGVDCKDRPEKRFRSVDFVLP